MLGKRISVNGSPDKERGTICMALCSMLCTRSAQASCKTTSDYNSKYASYRSTNSYGSGD